MNIIDRALRKFGYAKAMQPLAPWQVASAESQRWTVPDGRLAETQANLYRKLSWINIAVSRVASEVATCGFEVMELVDEKTVGIINHEFEELLRRPNPRDSRYELLFNLMAYYSLTGSSYW